MDKEECVFECPLCFHTEKGEDEKKTVAKFKRHEEMCGRWLYQLVIQSPTILKTGILVPKGTKKKKQGVDVKITFNSPITTVFQKLYINEDNEIKVDKLLNKLKSNEKKPTAENVIVKSIFDPNNTVHLQKLLKHQLNDQRIFNYVTVNGEKFVELNLNDYRININKGKKLIFTNPNKGKIPYHTILLNNCNLTYPLSGISTLGLTKLVKLDLRGNNITGTITNSFLENLVNIEFLDLSGNQLDLNVRNMKKGKLQPDFTKNKKLSRLNLLGLKNSGPKQINIKILKTTEVFMQDKINEHEIKIIGYDDYNAVCIPGKNQSSEEEEEDQASSQEEEEDQASSQEEEEDQASSQEEEEDQAPPYGGPFRGKYAAKHLPFRGKQMPPRVEDQESEEDESEEEEEEEDKPQQYRGKYAAKHLPFRGKQMDQAPQESEEEEDESEEEEEESEYRGPFQGKYAAMTGKQKRKRSEYSSEEE